MVNAIRLAGQHISCTLPIDDLDDGCFFVEQGIRLETDDERVHLPASLEVSDWAIPPSAPPRPPPVP
jgi:hypothetical protein